MTEPPDPPPTIATMRKIGMVWVVVGVLAVLGGAVATVFAVALFGALAVVLGVAIVSLQNMRARSAIRASQTLTNAPAPPADPPPSAPGPPEWVSGGPTPGPPSGPEPDDGSRTVDGGDLEADVGTPSGEEGFGGQDTGRDDGQDAAGRKQEDGEADGAAAFESEAVSASEEDDGTGSSPVDDDRTPGERRG